MARDPERGGRWATAEAASAPMGACSDCLLVSLALAILADPVIRLL